MLPPAWVLFQFGDVLMASHVDVALPDDTVPDVTVNRHSYAPGARVVGVIHAWMLVVVPDTRWYCPFVLTTIPAVAAAGVVVLRVTVVVAGRLIVMAPTAQLAPTAAPAISLTPCPRRTSYH